MTPHMQSPGLIDPVPVPRDAVLRADGRTDLIGLAKDGIRAALETKGMEVKQAKLRSKQLWHWMYNRGVTDFAVMTDIAKTMHSWLAEHFIVSRPEIVETQVATDGTFDGWGAFKDDAPVRCFAIAQPVRGGGGKWRPFASVGTWPQARVRGQVHIRLGPRPPRGCCRRRDDAQRPSISVSTHAATGAGFAETYALKGAATAMDAAALGCARW